MRLLFVSQDFPPDLGGIQTYSAELAERIAPRVERFLAVVPRRPGGDAVDAALEFPVRRLPIPSSFLPLLSTPDIVRLARRERFDVAFHAQWQTATGSLLARRLTGYPRRIVVAAHGRETLFNPFHAVPGLRGRYDALRRRTVQAVDHLLPVSRNTGSLLEALGADPARITVVHNGTDPSRFYPEDVSELRRSLGVEGRRIVLAVGRLIPRKGYDTTIQALPRVAEAVPDVLYLIVGDGPDRPRLEAMARDYGVADRVRFLGSVPHEAIRPYYNLGDVYTLPARSEPPSIEGFPIVYMEANACGKPVIGARSAGIPDAVLHEQTGLLIEPGNADEMADALLRVLTDAELADRLGREGRRRVVEELSWNHVADRIFAVLAEEQG